MALRCLLTVMAPPKPTTLDDAQQQINQLVDTINSQQRQIDWFNRQMFGRKSEKLEPVKAPLFEGLDTPASDPPSAEPEIETITYNRRRQGFSGGRGAIPDCLRRVDRVYDLPDDQKICPKTGKALVKRIGQDVSEQLAYEPASIYVIRHIRYRYARLEENLDGSQPQVITAFRPDEGLAKCLAAPSLLAQVAVSKFGDHLPLNRLEKIFHRSGVELSRSSMCRWMQGVADLCGPLLSLMKRRILESKVIQSDDTPVKQQADGKCKQCRFWSYVGDGIRGGPYVIYDYTPDRSRAGPETWLTDNDGQPLFAGYLQCDAYSGYTGFFDGSSKWSIDPLGCWPHVRRKFHDIRTSFPIEAHWFLAQIQKL